MLEKLFGLKENHTSVKTEIMAGITTFFSMAYILAINPSILSATGMNANAVLISTALAAALGTLMMAFFANYPIALASGMGMNVYFVYVCATYGFSWKLALLAVLAEGIVFTVLSLTSVRETIFNSIPDNLKSAVSCGIGILIAFIGLQDAKLIVSDAGTLVTYQHFNSNFSSVGIGAILALIGTLVTAVIIIKKIKGGILIGILSTWGMGMICQLAGWYVPNTELGMNSLFPDFSSGLNLGAFSETFGQVFNADIGSLNIVNFIAVVFAMLFVDLFDTVGTLVGVTQGTPILDKNGKLSRVKGAFLADSLATTFGAILGTSTTTSFVESATGISEGGRTGLASVVTAVLFIAAIFLSPAILAIPLFAIAPALIIVGVYMMKSIKNIDFSDFTEAVPAFLCIITMPLAYSISEGISVGIISYTAINLICGKKKKVNAFLVVMSVLFILKYILA